MAIPLKSPAEIEAMRGAGRLAAEVLGRAAAACLPGATTRDIDHVVSEAFHAFGVEGLFEGYRQGRSKRPFPASCCVSVNEEVVHGVPGDRIVREGDVVTIDVGLRVAAPSGAGWCADVATTVIAGSGASAVVGLREDAERLVQTTRRALSLAVEMIRPGVAWSRIAEAMQSVADDAGLGVVREYVGHGIGRELHEDPQAPAWIGGPVEWVDFVLRPGMVLAVEPIFTLGPAGRPGRTEVAVLEDGWTVVTKDRSIACHEEHTVAVTEKGALILTAA